MRSIWKVLTILALVLTTGFSNTNIPSSVDVHKLLRLSGLDKQIASFPKMVETGANMSRARGKKNISDKEYKEFLSIMRSTYASKKILDKVAKSIKANISAEDARELIKWFESPLGKRITKLEVKASSPDTYMNMLKNAKKLLSDKKRVAMAIRLDKLLGVTDMQADMMVNMKLALYLAFNGSKNFKEVRGEIYSQEDTLKNQLYRVNALLNVYTYRNLSIADLQKYMNFLKTDSAQNFNDAVQSGISDAFNQATTIMADRLAKLHRKYHK